MTGGPDTPDDFDGWPDVEPVEASFEKAVGLLLGLADPAPSPFEVVADE